MFSSSYLAILANSSAALIDKILPKKQKPTLILTHSTEDVLHCEKEVK